VINEVLRESGIPAAWCSKRFADLQGNDEYLKQIEKIKAWDFKEPSSLFLNSDCGTGKTHLSMCLFRKFVIQNLNELAEKFKDDYSFRAERMKYNCFYKESDLLSEIYVSYGNKKGNDENEIINRLVNLPVLIIDDLFASRTNDNARRVMLDLIDKRIDWHNRPTVISSNWNLEKIAQEIDPRIASRLASGLVFNLKNQTDYRIKK
jgi:DNA replication protein DnaC